MNGGVNVTDELIQSLRKDLNEKGWAKLDTFSIEMALEDAQLSQTADQLTERLAGKISKARHLEEQPDGSWVFAKTRGLLNQHSNAS